MKSYLIVDINYFGHHIEYIINSIKYLTDNRAGDNKFYFLIASRFDDLLLKQLNFSDNIYIIKVEPSAEQKYHSKPKFIKEYFYIKIVKRYIKRLGISTLLFLSLSEVLWGLLFHKIKIPIEAIWLNPLKRKSELSCYKFTTKNKTEIILNNYILRKKNIHKIFILNDQKSVDFYNQKIHPKFLFIPEPIEDIKPDPNFNIRSYYLIPDTKKIILLFGLLDERKGVEQTVNAFKLLTQKYLNNIVLKNPN